MDPMGFLEENEKSNYENIPISEMKNNAALKADMKK